MSTVIHSINYQFNPDKDTQSLCESIVKEIDGNGVSLSDITVESASTKEVLVTTQFKWAIKVTLKASVMSGKETKNATIHNSAAEAQAAAKKQGQYIIQNSLGKIELIRNINEDPEHYFKHSSAKLNGGKSHACIEACDRHCDRGQITCPRCMGRGTHKAITRKQDLLGSTGSFATINTCPSCKGKSTINCDNCAGTGEVKRLYTVHVDATRKHRDTVNISEPSIKKNIETFLAHQSHNSLYEEYLSPVVAELKDIDRDHCDVIYQSKTKYILLTLSIFDKSYKILGFGNHANCIAKPRILDDTLLPAINTIVGISPKINSTAKCLKLQSMPIIKLLLSTDKNRSADELESLLNKKSNNLLSKEITHTIIQKLTLIRTSLIPHFSLFSWLPFIFTGVISGFYFGLKLNTTIDTSIILAAHIVLVLGPAYILSKSLTRLRRKKLNFNINAPTLERIPALIASALLIASILSPGLLSIDKRWSVFFKADQYISVFSRNTDQQTEIISNPSLIRIAQKYLAKLGFKNITADGNYNSATKIAVNDLQKKLGLEETKYLDSGTMKLLTKYAIIKESNFSSQKNK